MKKVAALGLLLALVLLGVSSSTSASASSLAVPAFKVSLDKHALRSGQVLTATASSTRPCEWVLEWNGIRQHAIGTRFVAAFTDNWQDTIDVNVLPNGAVEGETDTDGHGGSDGLPDTGGPPRCSPRSGRSWSSAGPS